MATITTVTFYFAINDSVYTLFAMFALFTIVGISLGVQAKVLFQNSVARFLASISMEIYLSHMFVYRAFEKVHLLHITGNEVLNYTVVCIATLCGAIVMSIIFKKIIMFAENKLQRT